MQDDITKIKSELAALKSLVEGHIADDIKCVGSMKVTLSMINAKLVVVLEELAALGAIDED